MSQPTLINLYPKGYLEGLRYYPFVVTLDRCLGSCNTLDDLSNRVHVPKKIGYINLKVFNIITRKHESNF